MEIDKGHHYFVALIGVVCGTGMVIVLQREDRTPPRFNCQHSSGSANKRHCTRFCGRDHSKKTRWFLWKEIGRCDLSVAL